MAKSDGVEVLPEDSSDEGRDFDISNLRVNFSEEEASSQPFETTPVPAGKYPCKITDVETRFSKSEKNKGKPYWAVTLQVHEGHKYEGRKFWANVMLFDGALYSLAQLCTALGGEWEAALDTGKIPHPDGLINEDVLVVIKNVVDEYKIKKGEWDEDSGEPKPRKNDVGGFKPISAGSLSSSGGGGGSMLP